MKKYILLLLLTGLMGCREQFLNLNPTDRYTEQNFWQTEAQAIAGVTGAYAALTNGSLYGADTPLLFDALSPNSYNYANTIGFNLIALGNHDAANSTIITNRWAANYRIIGRANEVLANIGRITMAETLRQRLISEAKFLRALSYTDLITLYGGVPLITDKASIEQSTLPRNTVEEVRTQILKDLDEAAPSLPLLYTGTDRGRATRGAALALKARVLLYASRWADAAVAAKAVMDLKTNTLFPSYRGLFLLENEGNSEVIFDVQFKFPEITNNYDVAMQRFENSTPTQHLVDDYYLTDGKSITTSPLYNAQKPYDNRDPCFYQTIVYPGSRYLGVVVRDNQYVQTGYTKKKYTIYQDDVVPTVLKIENQSELNFIVLRYADVLLMYAEAQNEATGLDPTVYDALNLIRKRAGMPNIPTGMTQAQLRDEIRHERRIELVGEGLYYHDVRRWKTAETLMNADVLNNKRVRVATRRFNAQRDYLWPIPSTAIQFNPALNQNPNYGK